MVGTIVIDAGGGYGVREIQTVCSERVQESRTRMRHMHAKVDAARACVCVCWARFGRSMQERVAPQ